MFQPPFSKTFSEVPGCFTGFRMSLSELIKNTTGYCSRHFLNQQGSLSRFFNLHRLPCLRIEQYHDNIYHFMEPVFPELAEMYRNKVV